ncbi:uncharacterized protein EDB91DRAFT_1060765 [Suillus paluster]|uniref:uncharacterized protein n=1 Tax=Suillus paluster TaxID=48578 RepID=UPI001B86E457|nr:uncharacterized protein EDB91DRAFT_1060765 [Suillus paluster]KAG1728176.1 hypothetical protein EDB91DRAFT_1060765 [Suillus paluster]
MDNSGSAPPIDTFQLYDLRVEVICPPGERILCGAKEGDHFILEGEMLHLPPGQGFSIYSLSAVLPLLAAKQRVTHPNDWMSTDAEVACPDPSCKSRLRIVRTGVRTFSHAEVTAIPLASQGHSQAEQDTQDEETAESLRRWGLLQG